MDRRTSARHPFLDHLKKEAEPVSYATSLNRLYAFVRDNEHVIDNALRLHAEGMLKQSLVAHDEYVRGAQDAEVKAAQDASTITHNGWRQMAETFEQSARRSAHVADELAKLLKDVP